MRTFHPFAVLLASLIGATALFVGAQMTSPPTSKDNPAEEEVRRLNAEEVEAFLHRTRKQWRVCGWMILS